MSLNAASISTVLCKYLMFAERVKIVKPLESDGGKHVGPLLVLLDAGIKDRFMISQEGIILIYFKIFSRKTFASILIHLDPFRSIFSSKS